MLNPSDITEAIAAKLKLIPGLAAAMTVNSVVRINAFHYRLGRENKLAQAVYVMPAPSMLVTWEGTKGGNFNGSQLWKHSFGIYYRMANVATAVSPVGYEDLWHETVNGIVGSTGQNIRYLNILPGLEIMDTPSIDHELDEDLIDRFKALFVIPEIGDQ